MIIEQQMITRRVAPGVVKFSKLNLQSPELQPMVQAIISSTTITLERLQELVQQQYDKFIKQAEHAPLLVNTVIGQVAENVLFDIIQRYDVELPEAAPKFQKATFFKLLTYITAEQDAFWPLRSYIDRRRILTPIIKFCNNPAKPPDPESEQDLFDQLAAMAKKRAANAGKRTGIEEQIDTAAATPNGTFYFNVPFMQAMMNYAHLRNLTPKGKKYVCNGGPIPNEYAYIEFIIMHEFLHFTQDDFYYQRIIKNANPTLINFVGDFRSNYELVKSGFEQLPIGLYADGINYDRQKTYLEMYELVKQEMENLQKNDPQAGNDMEDALSGMSDDHGPGQGEGGDPSNEAGDKISKEVAEGKIGSKDIDEAGQKSKGDIEQGKDLDQKEAKEAKDGQSKQPTDQGGEGSDRERRSTMDVDYESIRPTYNWKTMIQRFIGSATPASEETYAKPSRRNTAGLGILAQTGAAAVKPGEKLLDAKKIKAVACIDASGSMSGVAPELHATIVKLMQAPQLKANPMGIVKFSGGFEMYMVWYAKNLAAQIENPNEKVAKWDLKVSDVMGKTIAGCTNFDPPMTNHLIDFAKQGWNVLIASDSDVLAGSNFKNLMSVISAAPKHVFVIFDSAHTYSQFVSQAKISTPNITHFV